MGCMMGEKRWKCTEDWSAFAFAIDGLALGELCLAFDDACEGGRGEEDACSEKLELHCV